MRAKCGLGARAAAAGAQAHKRWRTRPAPQVVVEALVHDICSHGGCAPGELVDVPAPRFTGACASWVPAFTDRAGNSQAKAWLNAGLTLAAGACLGRRLGDNRQASRGTEAVSGNEASEGTEDSRAGRVGDVDLSGAEGNLRPDPASQTQLPPVRATFPNMQSTATMAVMLAHLDERVAPNERRLQASPKPWILCLGGKSAQEHAISPQHHSPPAVTKQTSRSRTCTVAVC